MPRRRSDQGGLIPSDPQGLFDMLDAATPIGDIKSWKELAEDPTAMNGLFALLGTVPGIPARKIKRAWQDVPLAANSKKVRDDMPTKFLQEHNFKELGPNEPPAPDTFKYLDNGKIKAYSGFGMKNGKVGISEKTFDEGTSLKTLRKWMGY